MKGPAPKPAGIRARRNITTTAANLPSEADSASNEVPPLFDRFDKDGNVVGWHPMVVAWWASVWKSPMASEYVGPDIKGGLYQLAMLHEDFWNAHSQTARKEAASEIRLQEVRFGLSPIDRRRLQWSIEQGDSAAEKTDARRSRKVPNPDVDPRSVLRIS